MKHIGMPDMVKSRFLGSLDKDQLQSNAIDLKIDKVFRMDSEVFEISEELKVHRPRTEYKTNNDKLHLPVGCYDILFEGSVEIAEGEAGWVVTRSTLNRNGLYLTSGLYDSGYSGPVGACLHVTGGPAEIYKGTRLGQFLLFDAQCLSLYNGDYGSNSTLDKRLYK